MGKRLVKSPKVYFRDPGLLHALLGLGSRLEVLSHPRLGASWEGFELKHQDAPVVTKSMHVVLGDLGLEHLFVVHPGEGAHPLAERMSRVGLSALPEVLRARRLARAG